MFTSSPLASAPLISTKPLFASAKRSIPLSPLTAAASHRRITVAAASVSTILEPIPVNSCKTMSLYEILRVKQTASQMEIKTAYRGLAKIYHPDASIHEEVQSDGRDFMEIHNAYETLSDPVARALYDLSLEMENGYNRRRPVVGFAGGYYATRRWETDQCW